MMYMMTPEIHAEIVEAMTLAYPNDRSRLPSYVATLAMLKAMKPVSPKGWITQSGAVTNVFASNDTPHDGKLYGWSPLYTPTKD